MYRFVYNDRDFRWKVTTTAVFCVVVAIYSVVMLIEGNSLFWIFLPVCAYQLYNTFITISNPKVVEVDEQALSFSAYGRTHSYRIDELELFRIKELDQHNKLYLRVGDNKGHKGRYWIPCKFMEGGKDLWDYLAYLEYKVEPEQLKFRTRKAPLNPFEAKGEPPEQLPEQLSE